ncbi:MAG: NUDIX hydrolase [Pseudomonadota bacterium]
MTRSIRLAARALIMIDGRVLLVNAFPGEGPNLWCAPGGGCEVGEAIPDTLTREVHEELGLKITIGAFAGVSEFQSAATGFHQVDLFFHAAANSALPSDWTDPEGVVHTHCLADRAMLMGLPHKPHNLAEMAFDGIQADYFGFHRMVERSSLGGA